MKIENEIREMFEHIKKCDDTDDCKICSFTNYRIDFIEWVLSDSCIKVEPAQVQQEKTCENCKKYSQEINICTVTGGRYGACVDKGYEYWEPIDSQPKLVQVVEETPIPQVFDDLNHNDIKEILVHHNARIRKASDEIFLLDKRISELEQAKEGGK